MKKAILSLLTIVLLAGCQGTPKDPSSSDADKKTVTITNPVNIEIISDHPDLSGYEYLNDPDPSFVEITMQESLRFFDEKGSGIIVFSSDNCPWCERAIPELDAVAKEMGVKVYFVNPYAEYNFPDTKERHEVFAKLCDDLKPIMKKDENGQEQFYIPQVIAVKNGEIVGDHLSLVDGVESDEMGPHMSDEQKKELQDIYRDMIMKAAD